MERPDRIQIRIIHTSQSSRATSFAADDFAPPAEPPAYVRRSKGKRLDRRRREKRRRGRSVVQMNAVAVLGPSPPLGTLKWAGSDLNIK
ncbi:hypothetical protein Nepgr_027646 [Nepenthes gracilis]|uniref:Uncharacterized protein n=1 Tax=Nepenthes gracilis TaxID=150966 RepID=A0AAD3T972_NEPGR|nr:hypothetical protein Nepgr_027646 [Nepenthes gracilis]